MHLWRTDRERVSEREEKTERETNGQEWRYRQVFIPHNLCASPTRDIKKEKKQLRSKTIRFLVFFPPLNRIKTNQFSFLLWTCWSQNMLATCGRQPEKKNVESEQQNRRKIIEIRIVSMFFSSSFYSLFKSMECDAFNAYDKSIVCVVQYIDYFKWIICNRDCIFLPFAFRQSHRYYPHPYDIRSTRSIRFSIRVSNWIWLAMCYVVCMLCECICVLYLLCMQRYLVCLVCGIGQIEYLLSVRFGFRFEP